jgi:hypothetical protein
MVQNSRTASGPGYLRPLNAPVPVRVKESPSQHPNSLVLDGHTDGRAIEIASIADTWEINDEWWRGRPIARLYYRVVTREGSHLTIFRDLVDGQWYRQKV